MVLRCVVFSLKAPFRPPGGPSFGAFRGLVCMETPWRTRTDLAWSGLRHKGIRKTRGRFVHGPCLPSTSSKPPPRLLTLARPRSVAFLALRPLPHRATRSSLTPHVRFPSFPFAWTPGSCVRGRAQSRCFCGLRALRLDFPKRCFCSAFFHYEACEALVFGLDAEAGCAPGH